MALNFERSVWDVFRNRLFKHCCHAEQQQAHRFSSGKA